MSAQGWYYLHENCSLIYKPSPDAYADIVDSDFAHCLWPMDTSDREGAWTILVEALAMGADHARVKQLADKWQCDDEDADIFARRICVALGRDGNAWCATGPGFQSLAESPAGFGDTKLEAMAALAKDMGLRCGKVWRTSFSDLLSRPKATQP